MYMYCTLIVFVHMHTCTCTYMYMYINQSMRQGKAKQLHLKTTLLFHVFGSDLFRISALVGLVSDGLQMECSSEKEREQFGERLKVAIRSFTVDFLPHMNEEEEVRREGGRWKGGSIRRGNEKEAKQSNYT